jgi:hypothetical protein
MADLWVLVPSRGRPSSVERLVRACALTCRADTRLHFGFDHDDPHVEAGIAAAGRNRITTGPRTGLAGWTNLLAAEHPDAPALASLGDDFLPVTDGWDERLLAAIPEGCGFAYPNDGRRADIPEAVVISGPIVQALKWMCEPTLKHWYVDNVWGDLGRAVNRITYCRDVIVRHLHPNVTGQAGDQTYADAAPGLATDLQAYQRWRLTRMRADIATVREVCGEPGGTVRGQVEGGESPVGAPSRPLRPVPEAAPQMPAPGGGHAE